MSEIPVDVPSPRTDLKFIVTLFAWQFFREFFNGCVVFFQYMPHLRCVDVVLRRPQENDAAVECLYINHMIGK